MKGLYRREAGIKRKSFPFRHRNFTHSITEKKKWEKEKELRLSDAYIVKDGEPSLELKVKVINIRPKSIMKS